MDYQELRKILTAFADSPTDLDIDRGKLLVQLRDELIDAEIFMRDGTLFVRENEQESSARQWVMTRVAKLNQLADRVISYVPDERYFVTPSGVLAEQPSYVTSSEVVPEANAADTMLRVLARRPAAMSTVLYLTSDAGEGKSTLINQMARQQAASFKRKESDWLLIPISLGGRSFLRFDDVVVAELVNRLRFQFFYFDAFMELVRLGTIIPAFDGFEEMFVESGSGEALSALGNLMRTLASAGTVLIAARKAYFEYKSFETNAKLFDTLGQHTVEFARLALNRWDKTQFLEYCNRRRITDGETIYQEVLNRFDANHPLLTRAVLVRHLLDLASNSTTPTALIDSLGRSPHDYFFSFVNSIIEREATEKWIDRSGQPFRALLTVPEHLDLLSTIAEEMWNNSVDALVSDYIAVLADLFTEATRKDPRVGRQIKERLKQHALLVGRDGGKSFAFDHEEFRNFFLGEAIGKLIVGQKNGELLALLSKGPLPAQATEAAIAHVRRSSSVTNVTFKLLEEVSGSDGPASFTRENCGSLMADLLNGFTEKTTLRQIFFPSDALFSRSLQDVDFDECMFQPTSLEFSTLKNCRFVSCRIERFDLFDSTVINSVRLEGTTVACLTSQESDAEVFDPSQIAKYLENAGFTKGPTASQLDLEYETDETLRLTERFLRFFLRTTQVSERMIQRKLGDRANLFMSQVLPELLKTGIVNEVPNRGSGSALHYRLSVPMSRITEALTSARGEFARFVQLLSVDSSLAE